MLKTSSPLSEEQNNIYFPQNNSENKIKPIPVRYLDRKNYKKISKTCLRLACKGYKYIPKVNATGESSVSILEELYKSKNLKVIQELEFDPYFCEKSGLEPLSKVFKKFNKSIRRTNIIIRRLNKKHEIKILCPYLYRMGNLRNLRTEFPSTEGVVNRDLVQFSKSIKKCFLLKFFQCNLISLSKVSQRGFRAVVGAFSHLYKMESLKWNVKCFFSPQNEHTDLPAVIKKMVNLKTYEFKISQKNGWTSMTDGAGQFLPTLFKSYPGNVNPENFSMKFENFPVTTEAISELSNMLPQLSNIRRFSLELSNCRLGELEMMILANGFINCKQIKHLTLKLIEGTPIPLEDILQFVTFIERFTNCPKLDLFFRKLFSSEWQTEQAQNRLQGLENLEYVLTKQSLHVYKR